MKGKKSNSDITLLFGDNVKTYSVFRPKYPELIFKTIYDNLTGSKNLAIDIGAGTGISSIQLAKFFNNVIAVEPDKNLANYMKQYLDNEGVKIFEGRFNDLELGNEEVDLINCSSSFHWLDHKYFLFRAKSVLRKNGVVSINTPNIYPSFNEPLHKIIAQEFNNVWKPYCHPKLSCLIDLDSLEQSITDIKGFTNPEKCSVNNRKELDPETLIGFFSSLSYFDSYIKSLNHENSKKYIQYLRELFNEYSTNGKIEVNFITHLYQIVKK